MGDTMDEKLKKEEPEKKEETSKEEQKKSVAAVYGISLADIEEVHLDNGKEFFKFYDANTRSLKMIENRKEDFNISQQFKSIQQSLSSSQGKDEASNAREVFNHQLRYQNVELLLIPVRELNANRSAYRYLFNGLDEGVKKAVRVLLENMDFLDLEYINVENAMGIDKNHRVITAQYNYQTGRCELKAAEVRNYDNQKMSTNDAEYSFDITDEEIDAVIEDIDVTSDTPSIVPQEEIQGTEKKTTVPNRSIRGRNVNIHFALQAYQYPEIIERSEMSDYDKMMYRAIIRGIARKMAKARGLTHNKQYVYTKPNANKNGSQAAFVDSIWLVLLAGIMSGVAVTMTFLMIKDLF